VATPWCGDGSVPRIAEFFGIVIAMYHEDHGVPHFHAYYGEHRAVFACNPVRQLRGHLPRRVRRQVVTWASEHEDELLANWRRVQAGGQPKRIAPPS
jgi:hypothetical protein